MRINKCDCGNGTHLYRGSATSGTEQTHVGNAGGSQGGPPPRPMSLLQKVAQDAKRRTLTASQGGGLGLARELSQSHGNAPGLLQALKPPVPFEPPNGRSTGDLACDPSCGSC